MLLFLKRRFTRVPERRIYCPCAPDRPPPSPTGIMTVDSEKIPDLHAAVVMGDCERVERILSEFETAAAAATTGSSEDLLKSRCPMGWTPLHYAVDHNQAECAALLLSRATGRFIFFEKDNKGWIPFHHACCMNTLSMSEFLLEAGGHAQIYARENLGKTPLHLVCETTCSVPMAEFLIENSHPGSAVVYSREYADGNTPLHLAASQGMRALPLAELLIDKGGIELLEKTTNDGSTPLHKAFLVYSETMVELFFRKTKLLLAKTGGGSSSNSSSNNDPCKGVKQRLLSMMMLHEGPVKCPVCLEDFADSDRNHIVVLNCGHVVCSADHARLRHADAPKCPECRKEI